jgi:hypothetical protein
MQDDILLDTMTPRECFLFSAILRTKGERKEHEKAADKMCLDLQIKD